MSGQFHLFGAIHLLILVSVGAMAAGLARVSGANASAAALIRYGVGALLAVNELAWYVYRLHFEGVRFPGSAAVTNCATWRCSSRF